MTMKPSDRPDPGPDAALDRTLARALGPDAEDTAELSRAVLSRIAGEGLPAPRRPGLTEVLAAPLPAGGLFAGALLLAGAAGYALLPAFGDETVALYLLFGAGL